MGSPKVEIEISAQSRGLAAKLREARAKFGAFTADLKKNGSKLGAALNEEMLGKDLAKGGFWGKGGAQMIGNLGSAAIGGAVGFGVEQARDVWRFNDSLTRLQIMANQTPAYMQRLAQSMRQTSNATGESAASVLEAAHNYVALTGDIDGAAKNADLWARVATATGSTMMDVSGAAAALKQNLKISPGDSEAAFSALATQGKEGAIELKDLAAQLSSIAPQWAMFKGGTGLQGLKELGATLQVVKRGFGGDASETVTGVQSLLTSLVKHSSQLKKAGIKVFDKDPATGAKTMRNVLDIVRDIGDSKLAKDPTKLEKAFGRVEAYRAYLQLTQNRDVLDDLIAKSSDAGVIQRDALTMMESPAGRVRIAWERVKNAFAQAMTPERMESIASGIERLASLVGGLVDRFAKIADFAKMIADAGKSPEEKAKEGFDQMAGASSNAMRLHAAKLDRDSKAMQPVVDEASGWRGGLLNVLGSVTGTNAGVGARPLAHLNEGRNLEAQMQRSRADALDRTAQAKQLEVMFAGAPDAAEMFPSRRAPLRNHSDFAAAGAMPMTADHAITMINTLKNIDAKLDKGTTVKIDGNEAVKATANARLNGTRPAR